MVAQQDRSGFLRALRAQWPLQLNEKGVLAEFFGLLLVRGPNWRNWHEDFTRRFVAEQEGTLGLQASDAKSVDVESVLDQAASEELERHLLGDTQRLIRMITLSRKIAGVIGSMHWALVEFRSPMVATSDHPVVVWPGGAGARQPERMPMNAGLFDTLEIRVPVSPTLAVLVTWADWPDRNHDLLQGARHHATSLNAFTVAEAERQLFHLPEHVPPVGSGRFMPLSAELTPGYSASIAESSRRRAATIDTRSQS
jgi:hypothetical protein